MKMKHFALFAGMTLAIFAVAVAVLIEPGFGHSLTLGAHHPALAMLMVPAGSLRGSLLRHGRGVMSVRSESTPGFAEVKAVLDVLQKTFSDFKDSNDQRVSALEKGRGDVLSEEQVKRINAALDELSIKVAGIQLNGSGSNASMTPEQKAHAKAFNRYFRKGVEDNLRDLEVKATATSSSDPDGGFTVPIEIDYQITRILQKVSAMRSIATVMTISAAEYKALMSQGGASGGWVGQQSGRPQTNNPQLTQETFKAHEEYAQPAASQTLLDDSAVDIGQWLADEVSITFNEQEGLAFITGDGVAQPFGILSYGMANDTGNGVAWGKVGFVKTGAAGDFGANPFDNLFDLQSMLKTGYQSNASWLMNRFVQAEIRKVKDSQGRYIWEPATAAGAPATISGKPIATDDNMPSAGANNFFLGYGDFKRAYLIVDRIGTRVLRDPFTSKPNVLFYTTKRVGGGIKNYEAIKLLKCSA